MKALLARIPRDRSLLLLLAPVLAVVAFLAAGRSEEQYSALPLGAVETTATTSTSVVPFGSEQAVGDEQAADVEGSSVSRSGTTSGSRGSSGANSSGGSAGAGGATPTSQLPAWMDGSSVTTTTVAVDGEQAPTSTVPGEQAPEPVVDESPIAALLPISALLVLAIALFVVLRRRRSSAMSGTRPPPSPPVGA